MKPQKVLLLVNTGTPDSPEKKKVRKYLSQFLNDPDVIDLPWIARKLLVNFIIVPFRAGKSSKLYSKLWTGDGSPLRVNLESLVRKLNNELNPEFLVAGAMRYGNPSIGSILKSLPENSELIVIPLFPQYAEATTGSVKKAVMKEAGKLKIKVSKFIDQFCYHPSFIRLLSQRIKGYDLSLYDHLVFSYHSLPARQIGKIHMETDPAKCICRERLPEFGKYCYMAACYHTTRLLVRELKLPEDFYTTAFQSAMSDKWIGPFTVNILRELARKGKKKILVVAPSFVSDCLETTIEIGEGYGEAFISAGGTELTLAGSLNESEDWVKVLSEIFEKPEQQYL